MITLWLMRIASFIAGSIVVLVILKFLKRRPCWFFRHTMKHLSIEKRIWPPEGKCDRWDPTYISSYRHLAHHDGQRLICTYVTKWICEKCGEMGYFCVADERYGAWKIEHGRVVPDEKAWTQWDEKKT